MISPAVIQSSASAWSRDDLIALWSLIVGAVAIITGLYTLHRGNLNSSIASMIPLNVEIRERWIQYLAAIAGAGQFEHGTPAEFTALETEIATKLEQLMNVLEIAAAIEVEGTLSGVSRILMKDNLRRVLEIIIGDEYTSSKVSSLLQDDSTYLYIRRFLRQRDRVREVLPSTWTAYPKVSWWERARSFFRY